MPYVTCEKRIDAERTAYAKIEVERDKARVGEILDEGRVIEVYREFKAE